MAAGWSAKDYTPFFLFDEPVHTEQEIRAEYTRQRDIMMKRANRLEKAGIGAQAEYIRQTLPKLSEIGTDNVQVTKRLAMGRSLYMQKSYSIKGLKELQKMLEDESGELVPLGDVLSFSEYMQSWRLSAFSSLIVPSGEAAGLYGEEYQDIGGTFSDFYALYQQM